MLCTPFELVDQLQAVVCANIFSLVATVNISAQKKSKNNVFSISMGFQLYMEPFYVGF